MKEKFEFCIKIVENIILAFLGILFVLLMILAIQKYIFKVQYPSFGGKTAFVVKTESMNPAILTNDIVVVDKNSRNFEVGDIVSYEDNNKVITHRIIQIEDDNYLLQGDANNSADPIVEKSRIVGKVVKIVPNFRLWKMVLLDIKVDICLAITICLFLITKILNIFEEKTDGKEEKVFKN